MKFDLLDVTFTIPTRIDTSDRIRNLRIVVNFLERYFRTNILIGENSPEPILKNFSHTCGYIFYKGTNDFFHRTKILNDLAKAACTPFIVNYDGDVLIDQHQIVKAITLLRSNNVDMTSPYGGMARNILPHKIPEIAQNLNLYDISDTDTYQMNADACGGCVCWNKKSFISFGMENENFIDWGCEDNERLERARKLKLKIFRVPGVLYHLDHYRDTSRNFEQKYYNNNVAELTKISKMNIDELKAYISTWDWIK
jgi:hypothetical protein